MAPYSYTFIYRGQANPALSEEIRLYGLASLADACLRVYEGTQSVQFHSLLSRLRKRVAQRISESACTQTPVAVRAIGVPSQEEAFPPAQRMRGSSARPKSLQSKRRTS